MSTSSRAVISLAAIEANLRAIRARVGGRKVLAPIKANAYGHGAVAVAQMIEATTVAECLGVATVSEGLELRAAGITMPIMKLSVARGEEVVQAVSAGITLPVIDAISVKETEQAAAAVGQSVNVQLKVDTGMGRIGCHPADAPKLAELVAGSQLLRLSGIFSHMPVSDTPSQDEFSQAQIALFARTCVQTEAVAGPLLKHLANSGAVLAHPSSWFDMVRPGIAIYGAYPDPDCPKTVPLRPALEWKTQVSFVKRVSAGDTVSYGRTWTAVQDSWIATIPVGYGDGYSRLASNRGRVLIGGRSYPIAGRICMDQFMVDLGPHTDVVIGDQVTLIGRDQDEEITTAEIAQWMGSIPYEVTCLITARVQRAWEPAAQPEDGR
ncbi:MAG: alanine racemase [Propionibacteriaceae bacterium]|jgi:alanine racemase|nr:alanine racemase [Propionibacteriaceae bacterium]